VTRLEGSKAGFINFYVLFLDVQSAPNKGSVGAQNKTCTQCVSQTTTRQQEVHVAPPHVFFGL